MAGKTKNYTEDFKKQIVALKINGKAKAEIAKEYGIAKSTIIKWVDDYSQSGSFKAKIIVPMRKMNYYVYVRKISNYRWKMIF